MALQGRLDRLWDGQVTHRMGLLVALALVAAALLVGLSACAGQEGSSEGQAPSANGNASTVQPSDSSNATATNSANSNAPHTAEPTATPLVGTWSFVSLEPRTGVDAQKASELESALKDEQRSGGYVRLVISADTSSLHDEDAKYDLTAHREASDGAAKATEEGGVALSDQTHASYQELWDGINFANDYFYSSLAVSANGQELTETSDEYTVTYRRAAEDDGAVGESSPENVQPQEIQASAARVSLAKGQTAWKLDRLEFAMPAGSEGLSWPNVLTLGSKAYDAQVYASKEVATTSTRLSSQTAVQNEWADYQSKVSRVPGRGLSAIERVTVSGHDAIRFTRDGATNGNLQVFAHAMILIVDVDGRRYVLECDLPLANDQVVADPRADQTLGQVIDSAVVVPAAES